MENQYRLALILAVVALATPLKIATENTKDYSYNDQEHWSGQCTIGDKQSPININTKVACDTIDFSI